MVTGHRPLLWAIGHGYRLWAIGHGYRPWDMPQEVAVTIDDYNHIVDGWGP